MDAVPFIFDRFSNGSVSIFTFKSGNRVIVTANPSQTTLYPFPYHSYSTPWNSLVTNPPASYQPVTNHFAAQLDVNGDCASDIVLLSGVSG